MFVIKHNIRPVQTLDKQIKVGKKYLLIIGYFQLFFVSHSINWCNLIHGYFI